MANHPNFGIAGVGVPESEREAQYRDVVETLRETIINVEEEQFKTSELYQRKMFEENRLRSIVTQEESEYKVKLELLRTRQAELQELDHHVADEQNVIQALQADSLELYQSSVATQRTKAKVLLGFTRTNNKKRSQPLGGEILLEAIEGGTLHDDSKQERSLICEPEDSVISSQRYRPFPHRKRNLVSGQVAKDSLESPASYSERRVKNQFNPQDITPQDVKRELNYINDLPAEQTREQVAATKQVHKVLLDSVTGPVIDMYDYSTTKPGVLGVSGFNPIVKSGLGNLRSKLESAVMLDRDKALHVVQNISDGKEAYVEQYSQLKAEVDQSKLLTLRHRTRIEELRSLVSATERNKFKIMDLQAKKGAISYDLRSTYRQKIHIMFKAWRMRSIGDRTENAKSSRLGEHIKRILNNGNCLIGEEVTEEQVTVEPWIGSVFPPSNQGGIAKDLTESLCLEHVYGYRGRDCKGNLFRLRTGEAAYHVGSLGIINDPKANVQHIYNGHHNTAVTCIALHPDGLTIATGTSRCPSHDSSDDVAVICVWSLSEGILNPISRLRGEILECVSCLSFSKDGSHIHAVGGTWPSFFVAVYDWDSIPPKLVASSRIGNEQVMSISCNPFNDEAIVCGMKTLQIWTSAAVQKEKFRYKLGCFAWNVMEAQFFNKDRDHANGFRLPTSMIEKLLERATKLQSEKRSEAACAEAECGISCCRKLNVLLDETVQNYSSGFDCNSGNTVGFDCTITREALDVLSFEFEKLITQCESMMEQKTRYERSYDLDEEVQTLFAHVKADYLKIPQEYNEKLTWVRVYCDNADVHAKLTNSVLQELEALQSEWEQIVEMDREKVLSCENCSVKTPLGKSVWKSENNSLYEDKMQAQICIVFSGQRTFLTGTENGSVYFWKHGKVVSVSPLHDGTLFDMSIDVRGQHTSGSFNLVSVGGDSTIRLCRCEGSNLFQHRCVPIPSGIGISVSNFFGAQKSCGLSVTQFDASHDKDKLMSSDDDSNQPDVSRTQRGTTNLMFVVGTNENSIFAIDLNLDKENFVEITCGHKAGSISAICANPKSGSEFMTFGQDGQVRLWDSKSRKPIRGWDLTKVEASDRKQKAPAASKISCADWSRDGSFIAVGLESGHLLFFENFEVKEHVSKEFEVNVQLIQKQDAITRLSVSLLTESATEVLHKNRRQQLLVMKNRIEKERSEQQDSGQDPDLDSTRTQEFDNVCAEIRAMDMKMSRKVKDRFHRLQLIPFGISTVNRNRLKIESLLESQRTRGELRPEEQAELREEVKMRKALRLDMTTVINESYDPETRLVHIQVDPPLRVPPVVGQRMNLQGHSFRVLAFDKAIKTIKISPDSKFFAVSSDDGAEIRFVSRPSETVCKLIGYIGTLTFLDWAHDSRHIQGNSTASELKFWKLHRPEGKWESPAVRPSDMSNMEWSTLTCPMGWSVQGLEVTRQERCRLNVSRSNWQKDLMIVGYAQGSIDMCRFPCPRRPYHRKNYRCHAAPTSAVTFLMQDQCVITGGQGDLAILQWQVVSTQASTIGRMKSAEHQVGKSSIIVHGDLTSASVEKCLACSRREYTQTAYETMLKDPESTVFLKVLVKNCDHEEETNIATEGIVLQMLGVAEAAKVIVLGRSVSNFTTTIRFEISEQLLSDAFDLKGRVFEINGSEIFTIQDVLLEAADQGIENSVADTLDAIMVAPRQAKDFHSSDAVEAAPDTDIGIDHIFGYRGHDRKNNIWILRTGEIVYWNGCNVIICNPHSLQQRFFTGHKADITCSALHPDEVIVATADAGSSSTIMVWDSITLSLLSRIEGSFNRPVINLAFARSGAFLAVVTNEGVHRLTVFNWLQNCQIISTVCNDEEAVISLRWNDQIFDGSEQQIVTTGEEQILFWNLIHIIQSGRGTRAIMKEEPSFDDKKILGWELSKISGDFGGSQNIRPLTCIGFLGYNQVITGTLDGKVYLWVQRKLKCIFNAHSGPIFDLSINFELHNIATAGQDGIVKCWSFDLKSLLVVALQLQVLDIASNTASLAYLALKASSTLHDLRRMIQTWSKQLDSSFANIAKKTFVFVKGGHEVIPQYDESTLTVGTLNTPICVVVNIGEMGYDINQRDQLRAGIRSVRWCRSMLVFGTDESSIFCLTNLLNCVWAPAIAITSGISAAEQYCALTVHPLKHILVTASTGERFQVWSLKELRQLSSHLVYSKILDLHFSPDGEYLAIGTEKGCLVYNTVSMTVFHTISYRPERPADVCCVKFSPSSQYLAVGTSDFAVDVFDVDGRYKLAKWLSKRVGTHLDAGSLEHDLADGVVLCYLIQKICEPFRQSMDHSRILKLRHYKLQTERVPSQRAFRHRPCSLQDCLSLLNEGFILAAKAALAARTILEKMVEPLMNEEIGSISWMRSELARSKEDKNMAKQKRFEEDISYAVEKQKRIYRRIRTLDSTPLIPEYYYKSGSVDKMYMFSILRFLRTIEVDKAAKMETRREAKRQIESQMAEILREESATIKAINDSDEAIKKLNIQIKKTIVQTSQSFYHSNLMNTLDSFEETKRKHERSLVTLQEFRSVIERKAQNLRKKIKRDQENMFVLLSSCKGRHGHSGSIDQIDWSTDELVIQSTSLEEGELKFWCPFSGDQVAPSRAANQEWATHNCSFGWHVKGTISFEKMSSGIFFSFPERIGNEAFLKGKMVRVIKQPSLDTKEIPAFQEKALAMADTTGRIYLLRYPFSLCNLKVSFIMMEAFNDDVHHKRMSSDIASYFLDPLCQAISAPKHRFQIERTSPTLIHVKINSPHAEDTDDRCALHLVAEILQHVETKSSVLQSVSWLKYLVEIQGPFKIPVRAHTSAVNRLSYMEHANSLATTGKRDKVLCVWRVFPDSVSHAGKLVRAQAAARETARAALQAIRLGEGSRIKSCLADLIRAFDTAPENAKSVRNDDRIASIRKEVESMSTDDIKSELAERGVNARGLFERTDLIDLLCFAKFNPLSMKVAEIKAELKVYGISILGLLERMDLIDALTAARGKALSAGMIVEKKQSLKVASESSRVPPNFTSRASSQESVCRLFDGVLTLDMAIAERLQIAAEVQGIIALLYRSRTKLVDACLQMDRIKQVKADNIPIFKDSECLDSSFCEGNVASPCPISFLEKGGHFYDLAVREVGSSLLPGMRFKFKECPGRTFSYIRYDEKNFFVDRLVESSKSNECLNLVSTPPVTRIGGNKRIRWGITVFMEQQDSILRSFAPNKSVLNSSFDLRPTAFVYELCCCCPRLMDVYFTLGTVIKLFDQLDLYKKGYLDRESIFAGVQEHKKLAEDLGIRSCSPSFVKYFCDSIFRGAKSSCDIEISQMDWIDFMMPSWNSRGHLEYKFKINSIGSGIRIGVCVESQLVQGSWTQKGYPSCHLNNSGQMWRYGELEKQGMMGFEDGDIISTVLDQDLGILSFFKESDEGPQCLGSMNRIFGDISFGVQAESLNANIELLPS